MPDWNPNAGAGVLGLEWFPTSEGHRIINAQNKSAIQRLRSRAAEDIHHLLVWAPADMRHDLEQGTFLMEVYEAGNELPGEVSSEDFLPNAVDLNQSNKWQTQAGSTSGANIIAAINDPVDSPDTSDYVKYVGTYQAKSTLRLEFATAAWAAGRRVTGGRLTIMANRQDAAGKIQVSYFSPTGQAYALGEIIVTQEVKTYQIPWPEVNPETRLPWTQNDIVLLDSTASIRLKPFGIGRQKPIKVFRTYMTLDYVAENRVAVGLCGFTAAYDYNTDVDLYDPNDGTAGWPKADDTTYSFLLRRTPRWTPLGTSDDLEAHVSNGGEMAWRYLIESASLGAEARPPNGLPDSYMESFSPVLNGDGTVADLGDAGTRAYAVRLFTEDYLAESDDGQSYGSIHSVLRNYELGGGPGAAAAPYQTYTPDDNMTVDRVRWIGNHADIGGGTLTVSIRSNAGAEIQAEVLDAADLDEIGTELTNVGWQQFSLVDDPDYGVDETPVWMLYELPLSAPVSLTAATTYRLQFDASVNGTVDVLAVDVIDTPTSFGSGGGPTYGGNNHFGGAEWSDALALLLTAPDAVTGFNVAIAQQTILTPPANAPDWFITSIDYASITWSSTALGADFARYEIERSEDGGDTWDLIFSITDEGVEEARDYEGRRNTEALYRMRVVSSWQVGSDWVTDAGVTPEMDQCALLFVSNEDPTLNLGYNDIEGARTYKFLGQDEREYRKLVGRDYQVVTAPLEYRGDQFERDLYVWDGVDSDTPDRAMFDPLVALMNAGVSYICVLNETGRRWFADVAPSEGSRLANRHVAKATFTEITGTPSVVDLIAN